MKIFSVKFFRITILFMALLAIGGITLHQIIYTRLWIEPLDVVIYPINGDGTLETHNYINTLDDDTFKEIDEWFSREAKRFGVTQSQPIRTSLGGRVKSSPPALPAEGGIPRTIMWGLHLRYWVFKNTPDSESNLRRIRVFVAYYQGEEDKPLSHSVGLQRGLIGVVHGFGLKKQTRQNNIVIAHEILHTVGASDKYNQSGGPKYPYGFAQPSRTPLFPQKYAEIMAGRIPTSHYSAYMARSLKSTRMNDLTAAEIAWIE